MSPEKIMRKQMLQLLRGGNAHKPIKRALVKFPVKYINSKIPHVPYTPWHLAEHLRISQLDILEFIRNPDYISPDWPKGFWPPSDETADEEKWQNSVSQFFKDLDEIEKYVKNEKVDLFAPLPHAEQYTVFREILVLADHNAYHLGQILIMRKTFSR